ncbi:Uncharacterised protein [Zhongshania aliphaticivorans]|uniref:SIMPL domain-containing protein n=1 Tax=Zhongshania aliphaticivorans TaxID=1470434 RepID=A0A5S9N8D3_9GAMM|nr:SIMPL domain-containing protein [Zhongshania aliphaticivorans]CAA0079142.1 Uncharacterised protein [Zhongshania aliphaticivorans]CAA0086273.1 Uncharacterised protein [Zhongshania aliphaticivorans]
MTTNKNSSLNALILGVSLVVALAVLGLLLGTAATKYRAFERSVTVKGLSEREFTADVAIWPLQFAEASNDLPKLYMLLDERVATIKSFLQDKGFSSEEISVSAPSIIDKSAQQYGGNANSPFRYTTEQTVTVYTNDIEKVRQVSRELSELGKTGIAFNGNDYQARTEYIFTQLNQVKPSMVEEATRQARAVAEKFAEDSDSVLGKIKRASQGQFSISDRDKNNPHIKKVRVVSTVEYYLSD